MSNLSVLDCTLRDGGYCNQWFFGEKNTKTIVSGLVEAGIDIIECGFLTNKAMFNPDITKFTTTEEVATVIPVNREGKLFVCLVNYGEYEIEDIPNYDGSSIDGIRVAFHKKDMIPALELCKGIKEKGYKVFIQAMVSLNYSDEEFLDLIKRVNKLNPYAFYIVDSFGVMKRKDLIRLFYVVEHSLADGIMIGYHSHNNMQLAYSNAQALVDIRTKKDLIVDSSIFGMGRGAGNLNTELFVEYLNDNIGAHYQLKPLLTIIDEILNQFYQQNYWGYSLPNYLSAKHNVHPNYAGYLDAKKTLTVENMDEIFEMMEDFKRSSYDQRYIEQLYIKYLETGSVQEEHLAELITKIEGNTILIIAPGKSAKIEKDKIIKIIKDTNVITFSINFDYPDYETDYIFLSNLRRYRELDPSKYRRCIITSNIPSTDAYLKTRYHNLVNNVEAVEDNAGMMLIKYLIRLGASKILIAGIDGYSMDPTQNFADQKMNLYTQKATFEAMNSGINEVLREFAEQIEIEFVTKPKYIFVDKRN